VLFSVARVAFVNVVRAPPLPLRMDNPMPRDLACVDPVSLLHMVLLVVAASVRKHFTPEPPSWGKVLGP